jgi:thiol-disulfide isomerase/thioredoxin
MFEDADAVLPVAADGSFDGEIIANMPQMLHLSVGHRSIGVFVVPQEPQEIYIDLRKISRLEARLRKDKNPRDSTYVYTSGKYVDAKNLKKELTSFDGVMNNDSFLKKILNMPPQEYKDFLLDAMRRKQGALPANLPFNVDLLSKANIRLAIFNRIMGYERYQKLAYMQANDLNVTRYEKSGFTPAVPDLAYYSFLEDVIGNDMMYFSDFKQVVVRLSTAVALNLSAEHTAVERAEYFKAKTAPLLGPNREMLVDLVCAQIFSSQIQNAKFFTDEEKQQIRTHISNQEIAEAVIAVNDRVQAEVVEAEKRSASAIREVPAVSNEKLISAILNKYKGKTIVADIWATWCGPCRVANAEMKPVKEELRGKNVVFLYITGETSPLTAWHKMIPDIAGEHYRVSNAQWKYFTTSLGIQGIPTIMIFNKQGKQTYRETGFPGAAKVKQEILKNL